MSVCMSVCMSQELSDICHIIIHTCHIIIHVTGASLDQLAEIVLGGTFRSRLRDPTHELTHVRSSPHALIKSRAGYDDVTYVYDDVT